jgi:hypothetical protein
MHDIYVLAWRHKQSKNDTSWVFVVAELDTNLLWINSTHAGTYLSVQQFSERGRVSAMRST